MTTWRALPAIAALLLAGAGGAQTLDPRALTAPATISPEWKKVWPNIVHARPAPNPPAPDDVATWDAQARAQEAAMAPLANGLMKSPRFTIRPIVLGGVPALDIIPRDVTHADQRLVYVHGGGFTIFSARSSLFQATAMATATRRRVVSIDYTLAPRAKWQQVTDQVVTAYKALIGQGLKPAAVGVWGDSAGGAIVGGAVLKLRDRGLPMPGGVILWSPWSDVSGAGDTDTTLAAFDPILTPAGLKASALAYADAADQTNPYVSPVYGDFAKGFPPTLIQGGTREIFLSNMVRQYQALARANVPVTLDLYEGMIHVFQPMAPASPEGREALDRCRRFWDRTLR